MGKIDNESPAFGRWLEKNKEALFWHKHRVLHDLDPINIDMFLEARHWRYVEECRKKANEALDAFTAVKEAPYFDKQYHMSKWWNKMTNSEKIDIITYVWGNKGDNIVFGHDWWYPYFEETGFINTSKLPKPTEPITLYRAAEPYFVRGMSWTDSLDVAEVYTRHNFGFLGERSIFKATIEPESILAIIEGDILSYETGSTLVEGREYVVNHRQLPDRIERLTNDNE